MKWLALLAILLIVPSAFATAVTVDIFGTNASNAQSNITKTGNNSYNVSIWNTGDNTKTVLASINGNASDSITFTLHNFTAGRVIEVKVNSSSFNAYQADSTGTIVFTRTQTVRNQTYSFTPAVNAAGYNFTWIQSWIWNNLLFSSIPGLQATLDAMNSSSSSNRTYAQGVSDSINTTKANKTDIGEFTGGTIGSGRYGTSILTANISDYTASGNSSIAVSGQANISGDAYLVAGANITISQSGRNITIAATGSSQAWGTFYNTTSFTPPGANTWYSVGLSGSNNTKSMNHTTNAAEQPQKVMFNISGNYSVTYTAQIYYTAAPSAGAATRLLKNGLSEVFGTYQSSFNSAAGTSLSHSRTTIQKFNANDYIEFQFTVADTQTHIESYDAGTVADGTYTYPLVITVQRIGD